ncbi:uncharacterized protein JCM6883_003573 [Sporobolomyces salmoneus]|uniref:uncharacterized protein n=1 Tax=Sporobolomyces salmoneus TaxID=183962 RepID=UPI003173C160
MAKKTKQVDPPRAEPEESEEEEEFDLVAFQASLDQSVSAAKSLVDSWIPQDYEAGGTRTTSVQTLKDRARPPRMGLGASPAVIHKQQAEDRKLKERLLGKSRNGSLGDEGSTVKVDASKTNIKENGQDEAVSESDSDEEDSRSRVISKGKGKMDTSTSTNGVKHAPNNPFVTQKNGRTTTTPRKPDAASTPLFNDPSPSKPSPSKSSAQPETATTSAPISNRKIAPGSFYANKDTANKPAAEAGAGLSKNQRKKLRKQEREEENKKRLQEESRKEEESERNGSVKRAREEEENGGEKEDVEMETEETHETNGEDESTPKVTQNGVNDGQKKKKKKRKGKAAIDSTTAPPLLNL